MTPDVMIAVLFGALLHACWNALIRGSTDRTLDTVLVVSGAAVIAVCALPFAPLPAPASISADWCGSVTASSCGSLRPVRKEGDDMNDVSVGTSDYKAWGEKNGQQCWPFFE